MAGDAHAVFSAIVASEISVPNERTMLFGVKAVRDYLDTRDMLADGLTKGTISRDSLLVALLKGEWRMQHREQLHSFSSEEKIGKRGDHTHSPHRRRNLNGAGTATTHTNSDQ